MLSIITVTRNSDKTLQRTIDSVAAQNLEDLEYIVIDGASTDATIEIIKSNNEIITLYESKPDKGLYFAMNSALDFCSGTIVGIINSDDEYLPNAFDQVNKLHLNFPDSVIYSDVYVGQTEDLLIANHSNLEFEMIPHPACFLPRSLYEEFGKFDTSYSVAADYELMVRLFCSGVSFVKSNTPLAVYHPGGFSSDNRRLSILENLKIRRKYGLITKWEFMKKLFRHNLAVSLGR
jgi:glycosyltransferase involved in cell wall biosynthesis